MKCYVCNKEIKPGEQDIDCGKGIHRHANHRQSSILKAGKPSLPNSAATFEAKGTDAQTYQVPIPPFDTGEVRDTIVTRDMIINLTLRIKVELQ